MSPWLRWQVVVPRILAAVVAMLAAQFAVGLAVRSIAARKATAAFGSQVDIANARVSLTDGHVVLSGLSVADPRCPAERWFAADCCELEVAAAPLLHKQLIVEYGRISGARIGTAASENDADVEGASSEHRGAAKWFDDRSVEKAGEQLASIHNRLQQDFIRQLESVKRTAAWCDRFPAELADLDRRAAEFERHADALQTAIDAAHSNSLRHDEFLNEVPARITALREVVCKLDADFATLPQQLEDERRAIVAARRQDVQIVRDRLRLEPIDQNLLNAYLLREQVAQPLDELIDWLHCMRQVVLPKSPRGQNLQRGQDVRFAGIRPTPEVLVRTLDVQGDGWFMGRSIGLRGFVRGLTTSPAHHDEPFQVRLSATGSTQLELRASIDRTGGRLRDELIVDCREIPLAEQSLGRVDQLQLKLAPSIGLISVSMSVDGDKLSGDIQLVQKSVRITPVLGGDMRDVPLEEALDDTLGKVNSLATRISLHGTVDEPTCSVWSNLGPAASEALQLALQRHGDEHARLILAAARRQVDERLAGLERQIADEQARFATKMAGMPARIDTIASQQTRRERISVEQLGRRLPSTSLFRR